MTLRLPSCDSGRAGLLNSRFKAQFAGQTPLRSRYRWSRPPGTPVLRLASHIATSTDDLCFVNLQLEGVGRTAQRGQEQISAIGDLALADTTEPFEIANRHDCCRKGCLIARGSTCPRPEGSEVMRNS